MKHGWARTVLIAMFALFCLQPVHVQESEQAGTRLDRAMTLISKVNYAGAEEVLESHLNENPEDARAWYLLGYCRNRLNIHEESYAALTNATAFGAKTPDLHRELGYALQGMERWPAALAHLRKADAKDAGAWLARAQVQLKREQQDQALEALTKVVELDKDLESTARLLRARIEVSRGNVQRARSELKAGLRLARRSDMKSAYENLDKLLVLLDQYVLELYNGIFYRETVDEEEGVIRQVRRDQALRNRLADALEAFRDETPEPDRSPEVFRTYVSENDELERAETLLRNLAELFRQLNKLDLSDRQLKSLRLMMVRGITPEGISSDFLVSVIRAENDQ
jgi:tetratricopeptide (TPR) repeat protein